MYRYGLIFVLALISLPAQANPNAPKLQGISITADDKATSIEIDLSARAPLSTIVKPDRLEIDLPTASWDRGFPTKGNGGGLIADYRKLPSAHGLAIVLHTNTRVKIDSSQGQADADGSQHITIRLTRDQPDLQTVVTPDGNVLTGPAGTIQQVPVYVPVPVQAYAPQTQTNAQIAAQRQALEAATAQQQAAQQHQANDCNSHLVPDGRVGGSAASYPVYRFSDCP